ncbi:MAG TPA: 2OG-Fe(II) oxygenase [Puia sp.]|nr:2OG-Fe(II) oxygenase [Puia sp.]
MTDIQTLDWECATASLNEHGYALLPGVLDATECRRLIDSYQDGSLYRKTINMERYRFGKGEYKYFTYPLPSLIQSIREAAYPRLAPIANSWMKALSDPRTFPPDLATLHQQCRAHGQDKPTVLILQYGAGGHNTLHQDLYGEVFFPMQLVLFLDQAGQDYTGGEFVLVQQTPRAQSKAMVFTPRMGDMLIFTTNFRPVKGARGYYKVNMKHGVSPVQEGSRHTLGIIFHDAG